MSVTSTTADAATQKKRISEGKHVVTLYTRLTREDARNLDAEAAARGISRPELMRTFICAGLDAPTWTTEQRLLLEELLAVDEMLKYLIGQSYPPEQGGALERAMRERARERARVLAEAVAPAHVFDDGRR